MSVSPLVPLLLAACWLLPALVIALLHASPLGEGQTSEDREMSTTFRGIRAEILQVDYDARTESWREASWAGPGARVRARITDASHEIMVITPYAETSVPVGLDDRRELRKCTLSLN